MSTKRRKKKVAVKKPKILTVQRKDNHWITPLKSRLFDSTERASLLT